MGPFIRFMKFLSADVGLYLYKSAIQPCMEYYYRVWGGTLLVATCMQNLHVKQLCRTVGPTVAAFFEPLVYLRNVGRCSSELVELVRLPYSRWRSTRYSNGFCDFSVTVPR